jgi:hypothetical protein
MAKNDRELAEKIAPPTATAELAKFVPPTGPAGEIAIFCHPNQALMLQTLRDTFGKGVNVFKDLERVKNPTSGSNTFRVQSAEGEKRLETLVGIIVAWRDARVFFDKAYGSGPVGPPVCHSNDGINGHGDPGGECASCKFAKFGSKSLIDGKPSQATACRQMRQVLFLRDGIMPEVINVTPGSLNQITPYIRRILNYGKGDLPYTVLTEISLASERSGGGIEYSQLRFKMLPTKLTPEQKQIGEEYHKIFHGALNDTDMNPSDYGPQEQAPF